MPDSIAPSVFNSTEAATNTIVTGEYQSSEEQYAGFWLPPGCSVIENGLVITNYGGPAIYIGHG